MLTCWRGGSALSSGFLMRGHKVRTRRQHGARPRSLARCRRDEQRDEHFDIFDVLLTTILIFGPRSHSVKLLPLINIDQQAVGLFGRGVQAAVDDAEELLRVARAVGGGFAFENESIAAGPACSGAAPKASAKARKGEAPGRNETTSHIIVCRC
jgi:hypothetical protein